MENLELDELIKRFQSLQKEEVPNQISERNVVEIVNALVKKKLIDLLFTTDAKEYLTWEELKREIVDEVLANGGRLNTVDLPGLLSVHMFQVERVLPSVLEENPNLIQEGGELLTQDYIDSITLAAGDVLKEQGSLTITEFASANQLSSTFAKGILTNAVDSGRIDAVMQGTSLYTKQFVKLQQVVVRSGLLAAVEPVRMDAFYKRHNLFTPLLQTVVEAVRHEVPGQFEGYTSYIPNIYETQRISQIENLYTSNGYVEYAALQRLGISHPRGYLLARYNPPQETSKEGEEYLSVTSTVSISISASASGASGQHRRGKRRAGGSKSAASLSSRDAPQAIARATAEHPLCGHALASGFIADRYLSNLAGVQAFVDGETLTLDMTEQLPHFVDMEKDWHLLAPRLAELYSGLDISAIVQDTVLLSGAAKERARDTISEDLKSKKKPGKLEEQTVIESISRALKLPLDRYSGVLHEIVELWSDVVEEVQAQLSASTAKNAQADLKQTRVALQDSLSRQWIELGILLKGLDWAKAQLDDQSFGFLARHTLSTRGFQIACDVMRNEALDSPELKERVTAALEQVTQPNQLKKVLLVFPERHRDVLGPVLDRLNGKSVEDFTDILQEQSSSGNIAVSNFYSPNKKVERETYAKMKETIIQEVKKAAVSVDDAETNGQVLSLICSSLSHRLFHVHLEIPGKAVGAVVKRLRNEAAAPPQLEEAKEAVTAALQNAAVDERCVALLVELQQATLALC